MSLSLPGGERLALLAENDFAIRLKNIGEEVNIAVSVGNAHGPPSETHPPVRVWVLLGRGAGDNAHCDLLRSRAHHD